MIYNLEHFGEGKHTGLLWESIRVDQEPSGSLTSGKCCQSSRLQTRTTLTISLSATGNWHMENRNACHDREQYRKPSKNLPLWRTFLEGIFALGLGTSPFSEGVVWSFTGPGSGAGSWMISISSLLCWPRCCLAKSKPFTLGICNWNRHTQTHTHTGNQSESEDCKMRLWGLARLWVPASDPRLCLQFYPSGSTCISKALTCARFIPRVCRKDRYLLQIQVQGLNI